MDLNNNKDAKEKLDVFFGFMEALGGGYGANTLDDMLRNSIEELKREKEQEEKLADKKGYLFDDNELKRGYKKI